MSSLASGDQKSQIATDVVIFNTNRTDKDGIIEIITDGVRLRVRVGF